MFKRSFFVVLFLMLVCTSMVFAAEDISRENPEDYVPGEILIGFKPEATADQIDAAVASIGGEVIGTCDLPTLKIRKVRLFLSSQSAMEAAINDLRTAPFASEIIKTIEPNLIRQAHQTREPSGDVGILSEAATPPFSAMGYYDIGANWINDMVRKGGRHGRDYTHPDLAGKVIKGKDFVNDDRPMDDHAEPKGQASLLH
jgi:thermitase